MYLKNYLNLIRFGVGYNLRVELGQQENRSQIIATVNKYVKDCEKYELGSEIQFLLPYEQIKSFSRLFNKLEGLHYIL